MLFTSSALQPALLQVFGLGLRATASPNLSDKPLVDTAPVVGWGDYVWLVPIVVVLLAVALFSAWRTRKRL